MDRALTLAVVAALAVWPVGATSAAPAAEEGRLIYLSGDLAEDAAGADSWEPRHEAEVYDCRWAGETPGPALLGTIRAGALILGRNHADAHPSSKIFRVGDETLLLDTAGLGLGNAAGLDIMLLSAISAATEIEARYFGLDGWHTSRSVGDPSGVQFEGFGLSVAGQSARVEYASRLYSFELNLRPRVAEGVPLVLGFRTVQLHERFDLWSEDAARQSLAIGTHTNNFLYGLQIGAEPYLFGGESPLRLEGLLKAGVYGNHVSQGTYAPAWAADVAAGRNRASLVGEIGLMLDYRFSRFFSARAGYELLWLYGVALAPDQGAVTDLLTPSAGLNCSATAFYQGAAVSLEFIF